jgi:hypothetical protein
MMVAATPSPPFWGSHDRIKEAVTALNGTAISTSTKATDGSQPDLVADDGAAGHGSAGAVPQAFTAVTPLLGDHREELNHPC